MDIYPQQQQNYRHKIRITLHNDHKLIDHYHDTITNHKILNLINIIIKIIHQHFQYEMWDYLIIQKCFDQDIYGIHVSVRKITTDTISNFYNYIISSSQFNIPVFSYQTDQIIYHSPTKNERSAIFLYDNYDGTIWYYQIHSFIQNHPEILSKIHEIVNQWIDPNSHYLGIDGECCYYAVSNKHKFCSIQCLINDQYMYQDGCYNFSNNNIDISNVYYIPDFKHIKLVDYHQPNQILLINSKSVFSYIVRQIHNLHYNQIIYITCSTTFNRDYTLLSNYLIHGQIRLKLFPNTPQWITIYDLRPK